jgi:hypothetical protein
VTAIVWTIAPDVPVIVSKRGGAPAAHGAECTVRRLVVDVVGGSKYDPAASAIERKTIPLNPYSCATVTVVLPVQAPDMRYVAAGETAREKSGGGGFVSTVSDKACICVRTFA